MSENPLAETYVQVGPDSTGKKIRNLLVTVPVSDGSSTTAYMQVVGLADGDGFPLADPFLMSQQILTALHEIKESIDLLRETLE